MTLLPSRAIEAEYCSGVYLDKCAIAVHDCGQASVSDHHIALHMKVLEADFNSGNLYPSPACPHALTSHAVLYYDNDPLSVGHNAYASSTKIDRAMKESELAGQ